MVHVMKSFVYKDLTTNCCFSLNKSVYVSAQEPLPSWDKQIQGLCVQVNNIIEKIKCNAPDWANKYTDSQMNT